MIGFILIFFANTQPLGLQHFSVKETSFKVFLFGGIFNETYQNDLWVFDSEWNVFSTSITARINANMWRTSMDEVYIWSGKAEFGDEDDSWIIKNGTDISRIFFDHFDPYKRFSSLIVSDEDEIWVFGGIFLEGFFLYNDFWKYTISTNIWDLISGENLYNQVFVNTEIPSSRGRSMGWRTNNVFYMYGGYNNIILGDFWKYNSTWEMISSSGNFGLQENLCHFMIDDIVFMFVNESQLWSYQTEWSYEIYAPSCHDFVFRNDTTFYTFDSNFTFIDLYTYMYPVIPEDDDDDDTTIDDDDTTINDDDQKTTIVVVIMAASLVIGIVIICIIFVVMCCIMIIISKKKKVNFDVITKLEDQETRKGMANIKINKALFKINFDNIKIRRKLGKGAFAVVFLADWEGHEVAFKCFQTSDVFNEKNNFKDFEKEVEILSSIGHPNIIGFFGATLKPPRVGLVLEFGENGDLKDYLTNNPQTTTEQKIEFVKGITFGMCYLHGKGIIHRDLKCENVLIDKNLFSKITDFGVSKIFNKEGITKTQKVGTSYYMAPEVCLGSDYDESCDVYSFSIMLFEIFSGDFKPYGKTGGNVEIQVAMNPEFRPDISKVGDEFEGAKNIIIESWNHDPPKRPGFDELATFFKSFKI